VSNEWDNGDIMGSYICKSISIEMRVFITAKKEGGLHSALLSRPGPDSGDEMMHAASSHYHTEFFSYDHHLGGIDAYYSEAEQPFVGCFFQASCDEDDADRKVKYEVYGQFYSKGPSQAEEYGHPIGVAESNTLITRFVALL